MSAHNWFNCPSAEFPGESLVIDVRSVVAIRSAKGVGTSVLMRGGHVLKIHADTANSLLEHIGMSEVNDDMKAPRNH